MGLLDQIAGGARGGGAPQKAGLGQTVAAGVILALLVKAIRAHQAQPQGRSFDPAPAPAQAQGAGQGGLGGILGSLTGGGGLGGLLGGSLGGLLGGLGGAGALGGLVRQMQQNGFG